MAANRLLLAKMVWTHFWAIEIIIVVLVLDCCLITEFARAVGPKELRQMFFGPKSLPRS
jgi:hypothetical protein